MESRFGHDFSKVRVHADERSSQLAAQIGASAFTIQQDIYFGQGQYRPDLPYGQMLLAHELAHTIQQKRSPANHSDRILGSSDPLEAEAHTIASVFSLGFPVVQGMISAAGPAAIGAIGRQAMARQSTIQRSPDQDPEIIRFIAEGILRSLQVDPDDRSGIVKRQLEQMSASARAGVIQIVQARVSSTEWERLGSILAEPLPGMKAEAPEKPSKEPIEEKKPEVEKEPEVSEKTEKEAKAEVGADQEVDSKVGAEEQRRVQSSLAWRLRCPRPEQKGPRLLLRKNRVFLQLRQFQHPLLLLMRQWRRESQQLPRKQQLCSGRARSRSSRGCACS